MNNVFPGNLLIIPPGLTYHTSRGYLLTFQTYLSYLPAKFEIINLFITLKWSNLIGQLQAGMVE